MFLSFRFLFVCKVLIFIPLLFFRNSRIDFLTMILLFAYNNKICLSFQALCWTSFSMNHVTKYMILGLSEEYGNAFHPYNSNDFFASLTVYEVKSWSLWMNFFFYHFMRTLAATYHLHFRTPLPSIILLIVKH